MDHNRKVVEILLDDVLPNRFQPRIKFNEDSIIELSESIKEHGVIQPIVVRPVGDKYEIIAGERRYKASCMAGLEKIPALVTDLNDKDSAEVALIENVQRKDLTPIEEAISYKKILDMGYLTQEKLADKLGKKQSTVANKLRLLNLDENVQEAILEDKISERHARSLLKLSKPEDQNRILKKIIDERLTVRKTDEEINKMLNGEYDNNANVTSSDLNAEENLISEEVEPFDFSKLEFFQANENLNESGKVNVENNQYIKDTKDFDFKIPKFEDILSSKINQSEISIGENFEQSIEKTNDSIKEESSSDSVPFVFDNLFINQDVATENLTDNDDESEEIEYINDMDDDIATLPNNIVYKDLETREKIQESIGNNTYVTSDIKTVINTIRTCTETIQKYGFNVNVEQLELEDMYRVVIDIKK